MNPENYPGKGPKGAKAMVVVLGQLINIIDHFAMISD